MQKKATMENYIIVIKNLKSLKLPNVAVEVESKGPPLTARRA